MHAPIGSWTVTLLSLHVALRPSLCAVVVFFCVAETSDIKAYLTFSKTIQGRFGCLLKIKDLSRPALNSRPSHRNPAKMRFHETRVEKETWTWTHCYFSTISKPVHIAQCHSKVYDVVPHHYSTWNSVMFPLGQSDAVWAPRSENTRLFIHVITSEKFQ